MLLPYIGNELNSQAVLGYLLAGHLLYVIQARRSNAANVRTFIPVLMVDMLFQIIPWR